MRKKCWVLAILVMGFVSVCHAMHREEGKSACFCSLKNERSSLALSSVSCLVGDDCEYYFGHLSDGSIIIASKYGTSGVIYCKAITALGFAGQVMRVPLPKRSFKNLKKVCEALHTPQTSL